jgi:hypothetical protein
VHRTARPAVRGPPGSRAPRQPVGDARGRPATRSGRPEHVRTVSAGGSAPEPPPCRPASPSRVSCQSRAAAFAPRRERPATWPGALRPGHPGPTSGCRQLDPRAVRHRCISGSSRRSSRKLQGRRPRASRLVVIDPVNLMRRRRHLPCRHRRPSVLLLLATLLLQRTSDAAESPASHAQDLAPEAPPRVQSVTPPCRRAIAGNGTHQDALRSA